MIFSIPYATAVQVIIVTEDSEIRSKEDLPGKSIGTQIGTTGNIYCEDDYGEVSNVIGYDNGITAIQALKNGQIDCVVVDNAPAQTFVKDNKGLKILETEYKTEQYAIGFAKNKTELRDKVNEVLKKLIDNGTVAEIVDAYINAEPEKDYGDGFWGKFHRAFIARNRWKQYLSGVGSTLMVTALALVIGVVLGVLVAIIRTAHDQQRPGRKNVILGFVNGICKVYITVIRGTPMLVQLLIMGFVIFSSSRSYTAIGILTLGINSGAYVAEIIRGGLMSLDPGQMEASRSLGMNYIDSMRFVVVPQAFKSILPSLGNEFITLLKDTALIYTIGGKELVYAARAIANRTYEQMFPLVGSAVIYLVLVLIFTWLQGLLERRLRQSDRR
ncbi:MAG: ABC transporter substrate-binding protein/permease [Oscillospiraceae bacterium]|nr:ABC transporter substrate-binding protein/permease [Oscillospiraceae bacterium]